jgi:hypothetical protein
MRPSEAPRGRVQTVRKTRITLETERLVIVRKGLTTPAWCPLCGAEVEVITLDDISQILQGSSSGELHVLREPNRQARICLPSLLRCFELEGISISQIAKERS